MKILWVKSNLLHPLNSGGTIRSYQMLRQLRRQHHITYVALRDRDADGAAKRASEYCHRLIEVPWSGAPRRSQWRFYVQALANLPADTPLALQRYNVPALGETLDRLTKVEQFDVAVADFLFAAPQFAGVNGVPKLLFQHNVESLIWDRMAKEASGLARLYFQEQAKRMARWERQLARSFDCVVTVSARDCQVMRDRFGIESVIPIPTGVDTEHFTPRSLPGDSLEVLFVGSLDWLPNVDGVQWMLREIWPLIRSRRPDAQLSLVGRYPSPRLRRQISDTPGVRLHADVPDVRTYLWRAAVVVIPLRIGSGTRLKIFEALACGKAVVSTPIGAEGLPITDGTHVMLEAEASRIADATVTLLNNPHRRQALGMAGRELVEREYTWGRSAQTFADVCAGMCRNSHETIT